MPLQTLGNLQCRVVQETSTSPELAIILCHGYGAPGDDLVSLAAAMRRMQPALKRARFFFPEAPLSLGGGSRAWWHLDVMALQAARRGGDIEVLKNMIPDGLSSARRKLHSLLNAVLAQTNLDFDRVVLGGFSQGAMLATDLTLRLDEPPAALCILSGTLLNAPAWRPLARKRAGLQVFQSHGTSDPVLPFAAAEWLRDLLTEGGMQVDFAPFPGPHAIPINTLKRLANTLAKQLAETP